MYFLERPNFPGPIGFPTLVAITTADLLFLFLSQRPIMASDSPPTFPAPQVEYTSAVSIKSKPERINSSKIPKPSGSLTVQPNTLPPRANGETLIPDLPKFLFSIDCFLYL